MSTTNPSTRSCYRSTPRARAFGAKQCCRNHLISGTSIEVRERGNRAVAYAEAPSSRDSDIRVETLPDGTTLYRFDCEPDASPASISQEASKPDDDSPVAEPKSRGGDAQPSKDAESSRTSEMAGETPANGTAAVAEPDVESTNPRMQLLGICEDLGVQGCSAMSGEELKKVIASNSTVKQLHALCKEHGISGYSKLKKAELVDLLGSTSS
jgi:Rho termination factor, N-terminal domain